jgi:hypothetical protein
MGLLTNSTTTKTRIILIVFVNLILAVNVFTLPLSTSFATLSIACAALGWLQGCQNLLAIIVTLDIGGLIDEAMVCIKMSLSNLGSHWVIAYATCFLMN